MGFSHNNAIRKCRKLLILALTASVPVSTAVPAYEASAEMISGKFLYDMAKQIFEQTNAERVAAGAAPLALDEDLQKAAMQRAGEISVSFSHTRPNGGDFWSVCDKDYGENIAYNLGYVDPAGEAVNQWMTSTKGHRENMLNPAYTAVGIGVFKAPDGSYYFSQEFGYCDATGSPILSGIADAVVDTDLASIDPAPTAAPTLPPTEAPTAAPTTAAPTTAAPTTAAPTTAAPTTAAPTTAATTAAPTTAAPTTAAPTTAAPTMSPEESRLAEESIAAAISAAASEAASIAESSMAASIAASIEESIAASIEESQIKESISESIEAAQTPVKITVQLKEASYKIGQKLTSSDFDVIVTYADGSMASKPGGWSASPMKVDGKTPITISYKDISTTIQVPLESEAAPEQSSASEETGEEPEETTVSETKPVKTTKSSDETSEETDTIADNSSSADSTDEAASATEEATENEAETTAETTDSKNTTEAATSADVSTESTSIAASDSPSETEDIKVEKTSYVPETLSKNSDSKASSITRDEESYIMRILLGSMMIAAAIFIIVIIPIYLIQQKRKKKNADKQAGKKE